MEDYLLNQSKNKRPRMKWTTANTIVTVVSITAVALLALAIVAVVFVTKNNNDLQTSLRRSCEDSLDPSCAEETYDIIIVGGGTAGAAAAYQLSNNQSLSVLVLEWGENQNDNPFASFPFTNSDPENKFGFGLNLVQPSYNFKTADPILGADQLGGVEPQILAGPSYQGGRGWGGASNHHYLGSEWTTSTYDDYFAATYADEAWNAAALNPIKRQIEKYTPAEGAAGVGARGTSGRWVVSKLPDYDETLNYMGAFLDGLVDPTVNGVDNATSAPLVSDFNQVGQDTLRARQQNRNVAFPRRVHAGTVYFGADVVDQETGMGLNGRRLTIKSSALVNKVIIDQQTKTAKRVEVLIDGKKTYFDARREIILSAGGLRTPGILERSGIGRADVVARMGIPLVHELPAVGENLSNHPLHFAVATIEPSIAIDQLSAVAALAYPAPIPAQLTRSTIFRVVGGPVRPLSSFLASDKLAALFGGNYGTNSTILCLWYNHRATSRGSIHSTSSDPTVMPELIRNFFSSDEDKQYARDMYRMVNRLETFVDAANPTLDFNVILPTPATNYTDDAELDMYAGALQQFTAHPMGTCSMGKTAQDSVVDPRLRVWGIKNLRVADSSIFSIPLDGSNVMPVQVVGFQVAKFIQEE